MALGGNESYLQDLINLGADAQANLYELKFYGGIFSSDTDITIRNAGISLPERKQNTHDVSYLTTSVTLPGASYEDAKTVSITFRLDQNYSIYKKLLEQQKKVYGPSTSYANASATNATFNISVYAVTSQASNGASLVGMYRLKNCYIRAVKQNTAFSYDNSEPITITADIWYQQREDWSYKEDEEES